MIVGAHSIIYSMDPEADRAFLRDVLLLPSVDVGHGWLIFGLPPAEIAVHPSSKNDLHEFFFMTDDIQALVSSLRKRGVVCGEVQQQGWGALSQITLPGGGKLAFYEPRHARPKSMKPATKPAAKPRKAARHAAKKATATKKARATKKPRRAKATARAPKAKARKPKAKPRRPAKRRR